MSIGNNQRFALDWSIGFDMMNLNLDQSVNQSVLISGGCMVIWTSRRHSWHFYFFSPVDELKNTCETLDDDDNNDETRSNVPEFIEVNSFFQMSNWTIMTKWIFTDISVDWHWPRLE